MLKQVFYNIGNDNFRDALRAYFKKKNGAILHVMTLLIF